MGIGVEEPAPGGADVCGSASPGWRPMGRVPIGGTRSGVLVDIVQRVGVILAGIQFQIHAVVFTLDIQ